MPAISFPKKSLKHLTIRAKSWALLGDQALTSPGTLKIDSTRGPQKCTSNDLLIHENAWMTKVTTYTYD